HAELKRDRFSESFRRDGSNAAILGAVTVFPAEKSSFETGLGGVISSATYGTMCSSSKVCTTDRTDHPRPYSTPTQHQHRMKA
ncbi:unnamed protein product, partial [Ectocarpus sp. 4 AP-2014]